MFRSGSGTHTYTYTPTKKKPFPPQIRSDLARKFCVWKTGSGWNVPCFFFRREATGFGTINVLSSLQSAGGAVEFGCISIRQQRFPCNCLSLRRRRGRRGRRAWVASKREKFAGMFSGEKHRHNNNSNNKTRESSAVEKNTARSDKRITCLVR